MGNGRRWSRDVIPVWAGENLSRTDPAQVSRLWTNRRLRGRPRPVLSDGRVRRPRPGWWSQGHRPQDPANASGEPQPPVQQLGGG